MSLGYFGIIGMIIAVIVTGAVQTITIPIIVTEYKSVFFIVVSASLEIFISYTCIIVVAYLRHRYRNKTFEETLIPNMKIKFKPKYLGLIILTGVFYGISNIALVEASDPNRTEIIIQAIFSGLGILPSCILTKFYLKKNVTYTWKYIILSLFCISASIGISVIPESMSEDGGSWYWSFVFLFGIVSRTISAVFQEKYFILTNDSSLHNKMINIFYSRIFQLITLIMYPILCGLVSVINITENYDPLSGFEESWDLFFSTDINSLLLQIFVLGYFFFCWSSIYLTSISANYNMIACISISPISVIFFTIFPSLNKGENYSLYITIPSLFLSLSSILFWSKGEIINNEETINNDGKLKGIISSTTVIPDF